MKRYLEQIALIATIISAIIAVLSFFGDKVFFDTKKDTEKKSNVEENHPLESKERIDKTNINTDNFIDPKVLIGTYSGHLDHITLAIIINDINPNYVVFGYNIAGKNRRNFTGRLINYNTKDKTFSMLLNEPGDHYLDGLFEINFQITHHKIIGKGVWNSYSKKLHRTVNVEMSL